ncbi:hypothetical protein LTR53_006150 [Teratosphaeriaceae sp. CCFEE 6253]|nr:hypothetical protein LTR53_006150 [Teratosphaeriaceae sp. CCFEE 6253]
MKLQILPTTALLALSSIAAAQDVAPPSAPFQLILLAKDCAYNGSALYACHEGAAIEGLCTGNKSAPADAFNTFGQNYTTSGVDVDPNVGAVGILTWVLQASDFSVPSAMSLYFNPASNVAIPLFEPGTSGSTTPIAFDKRDRLNIPSYVDDTVTPPTASGTSIPLRRWYVCQNYYSGYSYVKSLSWVVGPGRPQNPSCEKVEVVRVFV